MDHIRQAARIFRALRVAATEEPPQRLSSGAADRPAAPSIFSAKSILDRLRDRIVGRPPVRRITTPAIGCLALLLAVSVPFRDASPTMDASSGISKRFKVSLPITDVRNLTATSAELNGSPPFDAIHFSPFTIENAKANDAARPGEPEPAGLPLQRYDLSQLRLAATIRSREVNRALVKTPDGKGFIVQEGTPIGRNSGFVVDIQKDRIIVEERLLGKDGEAIVRWEALKLPGEQE